VRCSQPLPPEPDRIFGVVLKLTISFGPSLCEWCRVVGATTLLGFALELELPMLPVGRWAAYVFPELGGLTVRHMLGENGRWWGASRGCKEAWVLCFGY
jgi:hypothetical protein